jgi:hypothetical protein
MVNYSQLQNDTLLMELEVKLKSKAIPLTGRGGL